MIALVHTVTICDHLHYLTDALSGIRVSPNNYLVDSVEVTFDPYHDDRFDPITVPFAVTVYDDGLDYDTDGNAYFDDYPGDHAVSFHHTRKSAEAEAAWLEHHGTSADRINIVEDYRTYRWELQYHPIMG